MNEYLPILLISFNLIILILLLFYWSSLVLKDKRINDEKKKILDEAEEIVKRAHLDAEKIIADAKSSSTKLEQVAQQTFKDAVDDIKNETTNFYKNLEQKYSVSNEQFLDTLQSQSTTEIAQLGSTAESNLKKANKVLLNKVAQEFEKAKSEISQYKTTRTQEINSEIAAKVEELAKSMLPASITLESHEKLLKLALQKAKEDGILS